MSRTHDVSGNWSGVYYQHGTPHPIEAELEQTANRVAGTMRDGHTERELSIFDLASESGLPPGADEQIVARLHEMFPDRPEAPIRYISRLPSHSRLTGEVKDNVISFIKTYEGEHLGGFRMGDTILGFEKTQHEVHYQGRIDLDGLTIEGNWWIEADESRKRVGEGSFALSRAHVVEDVTEAAPKEPA